MATIGGPMHLQDGPLCRRCGVQYPLGAGSGPCPVCEDEREYVDWSGQHWTTPAGLHAEGVRGEVCEEVPGLWGVGTTPSVGIGQRALLVPGPGGNVLWDCTALLDDATVQRVHELGGIDAIAVSHPHYYSTVAAWSSEFGDVPVYVHAADLDWVPRGVDVEAWDGAGREILPGRTLVHLGVHFAGGSVLHWADGTDGRGAVCAGDIVTVVPDRRWVGFMYSYPNLIPEHPDTVRRAVAELGRLRYGALYGAWWGHVVQGDAHDAVVRSARRYLRHLGLDPGAADADG
ncbi:MULTISPECIES: MBL fold metallo-hydrolase [unclassified Pseudonocardia]|uniref:MBL fold metallo-hydrolase n=1 Tax=unclassified Pseudonocardia TaxID=2619320 RepID=UPI0009F8E945|nr:MULTISPECIES: MBL fold metallo-hydrolase [unclassified Pseudonocardia]